MAVVEISLTAEQLAAACAQLSDEERRSFLEAFLSDPSNQQVALQLLVRAQAVLKRKLSPAKQQLLDRLLSKNTEGKLRASERKQLEQLMAEYGEGLVEKARAVHIGIGSACDVWRALGSALYAPHFESAPQASYPRSKQSVRVLFDFSRNDLGNVSR